MATVLNNSLVSTTSVDESQFTDASRAYSLADYSGGNQVGLRITAGDLSGATIQSVDPGALLAAQSIAQTAIDSNTASVSRIAGAASLAIDKAFGLGSQASQTDTQAVLGALVKVSLAVAGLGLIGGLIYWASKRKEGK